MSTGSSIFRSLSSVVNPTSSVPYYAQVKEALQKHIDNGDWKAGTQLPGEPELCQIFNVSRAVIRQALTELTYEGVVVRRKGKGTFVAEPKISENLVQRLTGFYQDMQERGYPPISEVLKQGLISANAKLAARLNVVQGTPLVEIERLRFVQGEPIVLVTTYLPYNLCPELLREDLSYQSLYAFLEKRYGLLIVRGHRTLEAVAANEYEAKLLQVEPGAPLMLLDSVSYLEDGTPIEYYHALHRGDRSRFETELLRIPRETNVAEVLGRLVPQQPLPSAAAHSPTT